MDRQQPGRRFFERRRRRAMRILNGVLALMVALLLCSKLYADDQAKDNGNGVGQSLAEKIQDLNLTDEQEAKIADIRKECRPKVQEASKELAAIVKEEVEKIQGVLTADQKEKLQGLKEERKEHKFEGLAEKIAHLRELDLTDAEMTQIGEIRNEYRPKVVKALEGFKGILNTDQTRAREEGLNAGKKRSEVMAALNLTGDQKEKCEAVCKEVAGLFREEMEKIRDVLTAEQREKLAELKDERKDRVRDRLACRIANLSDLNLTDEQKTKIADIRTEFRPKVQEAGNKLRAAVRDELEMIVAIMKG
jgi:Spy/CpxP family protein refolding chaperone